MKYGNRWEVIEEIPGGGQGRVIKVFDSQIYLDNNQIKDSIRHVFQIIYTNASGNYPDTAINTVFEHVQSAINSVISRNDYKNHYALKILHPPENARDPKLANERIAIEIKSMSEVDHPNLLKVIAYDMNEKWFVTKFYANGTLENKLENYKGNLLKTLKAVRPLVEGLSQLHEIGKVHRDIKPQNIFLDEKMNFVLGDFGLIYEDDSENRISATFQNVGSRDWQPPWTMGKRVNIKPTFDVFGIGKVIWAMLTGIPILQLWYFEENDNNIEMIYPKSPGMKLVNQLFRRCIVEKERECIPNANDLLQEIDDLISKIELNADLINNNVQRICRVCGIGNYELAADENNIVDQKGFGLNIFGSRRFKIFKCTYCGHVQFFHFVSPTQPPKLWKETQTPSQ